MLDVTSYRGISGLPQTYSKVFAESSATSVFLTRDWFENFERTILGDGQAATVYGVERQAPDVEAIAALVLQDHERSGVFGPRSLTSLANYYSCFYGVARRSVAGIEPTAIADAIVAALSRDRASWDIIDLRPLLKSSTDYSLLADSFRRHGFVVQSYFCFGNWYLEVGGRSYAEYVSTLSSVLRKNIPYNLRRFQRSAANHMDIVTGGAALAQALADYETVYLSSWKVPEPYPEFIRRLVRRAAELGWLRLGVAYVDGKPAAAQIWLVCSGVASIYKIAYDQQYSKLSVGSVLTARLMEHVIDEDRVTTVDYLSGDDDYKSKWMSARREFWGLLTFNPRSIPGVLQIGKHVGGRFLKNRWRTVRNWTQRLAPGRRDTGT